MAAPRLCSAGGDAKALCASLADDVFNFSPTIVPPRGAFLLGPIRRLLFPAPMRCSEVNYL
jgi:hypothetical protein